MAIQAIQVDSRESGAAQKRIGKQFDSFGVRWFVSKLYAGDYCDPTNPSRIVERKKTIAELAQNVTIHKARFIRELEKLKLLNAKMTILIEETSINGKPIKQLSDLVMWSSPDTLITGERVYRNLNSLCYRYGLTVVFCDRLSTGKKIIAILEEDELQ